jgi:hypothetical protein
MRSFPLCVCSILTGTRHGWGIKKDEPKAVTYLSAAAANSADIESLALQAGMKKGGEAKGELTLAIFELANCFRNGWGVAKDPVAAKQYYETAANMGDTDAMNEVAWCYLEGFGCKKDKVRLPTCSWPTPGRSYHCCAVHSVTVRLILLGTKECNPSEQSMENSSRNAWNSPALDSCSLARWASIDEAD